MTYFTGITLSSAGAAVTGGIGAVKDHATGLTKTVVEESGLSHLAEDKRIDGYASLGQVCGEIVKRSLIYAKWHQYIVDPLLNAFTVTPKNGIALKICKWFVLTFLTLVVGAVNLALIPFYIAEEALDQLKLIFTVPFTDKELIKEKRYFVRYGAQIPDSLAGVLGAIVIGPLTGIAATMLDFSTFGKSF